MFSKDFFVEKLNTLMQKNNLSKQALAEILGVSRQAVSKIANGANMPTIDNLILIANYFNVSLDYLVGRNDDPQYEYYLQKAEHALLQDMTEDFITLFNYAKAKGLKQQPILFQEHFQLIKWFENWKQEIAIQQEYYDAKKAYDEQEEQKYYEKQFKSKSPFQSIEPKSKGIVDAIKEKFLLKEPVFNYSNKKTSADWKRDKNLEDNFHRLRDMSLDFPYIEFPSIPMPNQLSEYLLPIVEADIQEGIADYVKKIGD